jgi:hypothetical protein
VRLDQPVAEQVQAQVAVGRVARRRLQVGDPGEHRGLAHVTQVVGALAARQAVLDRGVHAQLADGGLALAAELRRGIEHLQDPVARVRRQPGTPGPTFDHACSLNAST